MRLAYSGAPSWALEYCGSLCRFVTKWYEAQPLKNDTVSFNINQNKTDISNFSELSPSMKFQTQKQLLDS